MRWNNLFLIAGAVCRTIYDTTAPVIVLLGGNPFYLWEGQVYVEPGYYAVDVPATGLCPEMYGVQSAESFEYPDSVLYVAEDLAGNTGFLTREIVPVHLPVAPCAILLVLCVILLCFWRGYLLA